MLNREHANAKTIMVEVEETINSTWNHVIDFSLILFVHTMTQHDTYFLPTELWRKILYMAVAKKQDGIERMHGHSAIELMIVCKKWKVCRARPAIVRPMLSS
jgi:hypothetical protein